MYLFGRRGFACTVSECLGQGTAFRKGTKLCCQKKATLIPGPECFLKLLCCFRTFSGKEFDRKKIPEQTPRMPPNFSYNIHVQ